MFRLFLRNTWEVLKIVIIALLIIIPVRYFIAQPFFVKGASMQPNFNSGEYLIVNEISYHFREPQRGEVVVFKYPKDPSQYYIKRIIGLPGDEVSINGQVVSVNGVEQQEDYLDDDLFTYGDLNIVLGEDEYFVLGDNRRASSDSRSWGKLPEKNIIGVVLIRLWPFKEFKIFK